MAPVANSRGIRNGKRNLSGLMNGTLVFGLVLTFAIALGSWLGWQLLRQNGRILLRLDELEKRLNEIEFGDEREPEGLPLGSVAPEFELPDLEGKPHKLTDYRGQSLLLIFFNPECGFCREMTASWRERGEISKQKTEMEQHPAVLLISTGEEQANLKFFDEHPMSSPVLLQKDKEVGSTYKANGTPTGYLIDPEGKIASELAIGAEALMALGEGKAANRMQNAEIERERTSRFSQRSLARSKIKRDGLKAGTPAPDFHLPRLDGRGDLSLADFRGSKVLLVFSDPDCGPCQALAPELKKFHLEHPEIHVVMISRGDAKENRRKARERNLTFPIALQQQWEISRLYAMFATPVAYLVNEEGIIAHDVAVGVD